MAVWLKLSHKFANIPNVSTPLCLKSFLLKIGMEIQQAADDADDGPQRGRSRGREDEEGGRPVDDDDEGAVARAAPADRRGGDGLSDIRNYRGGSSEADTPRPTGETLRAIRLGDPGVTSLVVDDFSSIDGSDVGRCVGQSRRLKTLVVDADSVMGGRNRGSLSGFLAGAGGSRSIEHLSVRNCILGSELRDAFVSLLPLVECTSRLRSVSFEYCGIGDALAMRFLDALSARRERASLGKLVLSGNDIGDECALEIVRRLRDGLGCGLLELSLACNDVGRGACHALGSMLSDPSCELRALGLDANQIDDAAASYLAEGLARNGRLRRLNLRENPAVTPSGWRSFLGGLSESAAPPICYLDLSSNNINNEAAPALGRYLAESASMHTLVMEHDTEVDLEGLAPTPRMKERGWRTIFDGLRASRANSLEVLDLGGQALGAGALAALSNLLAAGSSVRRLSLKGCHRSSAGWAAFFQCLRCPACALEDLDVAGNGISDDAVAALTGSLASNATLERIDLAGNPVTAVGWMLFFRLLCDKSSVSSTARSNHALRSVSHEVLDGGAPSADGDVVGTVLARTLRMCLDMNSHGDKSDVVREKILLSHFVPLANRGVTPTEFLGMDASVLPHALAWIGRASSIGRGLRSGRTLQYQVIRSLPCLFDPLVAAEPKRGGCTR